LFLWWERKVTMKIRVSLATASLLQLKNYALKANPTTLYFLLSGECKGGCLYCTHRKGYLSRVRWPEFDFEDVKDKIKKTDAKRICIQCPHGEGYIEMLEKIVRAIGNEKPVSVSITAITKEEMKILHDAGVERIGIGLDCATEEIFNRWKKRVPSWNAYMEALTNAKKIFGNVTCHLIIGLGESDEEAIELMKKLSRKGIKIALFAFFRKNVTAVDLSRYRAIQIARYFIEKGEGKFYFDNGKLIEMEIPYFSKEAFITSGCPDCNRPFYNERVTKIYNYPYLLNDEEAYKALKEARKYARIYIASE